MTSTTDKLKCTNPEAHILSATPVTLLTRGLASQVYVAQLQQFINHFSMFSQPCPAMINTSTTPAHLLPDRFSDFGPIGDLDGGEDNPPDDVSLSGEEAGASDQDDSAECDGSSSSFAPLYNEEPRTHESPDTPDINEEDEKRWKPSDEEEPQMEEEEEEEEEVEPSWNGPGQCHHSFT
ncbi:zinc finger protein ZFPM1 isoform X1 [Tachysurus ichikawai]